jgi:CBS domain-containing protein
VDALLPVLIASMLAHAFTVLVMKRSILTEKVARRGYHLTREYTVDPLEIPAVEEVMTRDIVTVASSVPAREVLEKYFQDSLKHQGYPVVNDQGNLIGIVTRSNLLEQQEVEATDAPTAADLMERELIVAYPDESCRSVAEKMAQHGVGRLPVVSRDDPRRVLGIVTRSDLLKARMRAVNDERRRERFILLRPSTARRHRP